MTCVPRPKMTRFKRICVLLAQTIRQITSNCLFQDKELDVEVAMTLHYASSAGACGRDLSRLDPGVYNVYRYLEKHCAFHKIHSVRSVADPDNRFPAKTRDHLICESQFAQSDRACADGFTE